MSQLKIINEKYFLTYNYIFSMFNLITFEIIKIIEDGLLYILTPKFLINFNKVFKYKDEKIKLNF